MSNAGRHAAAIQTIMKIIRDQKVLEKHQRANDASVETLQDSMVYAYDAIVALMKPFMDGAA